MVARTHIRLLVLTVVLGSWASAGWSALVVMTDGRILKADSVQVQDGLAEVRLPSGGELNLPMSRVERVLEDEIGEAPGDPLEAPSIELGFRESDEAPDTPYGRLIFEAGRRLDLNPHLLAAMVRVGSGFDPAAESKEGAVGLMPLMPATARRLGLDPAERYDPELSIDAGARYLVDLAALYRGDIGLMLAAYHSGEAVVARYGGVPPIRETRDYVKSVYSILGIDVGR